MPCPRLVNSIFKRAYYIFILSFLPLNSLKIIKSRIPRQNLVPTLVLPTDHSTRRDFVKNAAIVIGFGGCLKAEKCSALVKGSSPPDSYGKLRKDENSKTKNVAEAKEQASMEADKEKAAQELEDGGKSYVYTTTNVRYKDMTEGSGFEVNKGSTIKFRYRVLRLGKRAYDGISGEGSTIFSFGYGEDGEKEGSTIESQVGVGKFVAAVDEAIIGMKAGGIRRVLVRPDKGWNKSSVDPRCAPTLDLGKAGAVPGAITFTEGCMDLTLLPAPIGFQAQRKFARRFDEALIAEIEVVDVSQ